MMIPFNKPYLTDQELVNIKSVLVEGKLSGNRAFTMNCHKYFEERFGFIKCFMTTSCTDALEMSAILANIQPEDEVIMPTFTFVSTANAFILRGAKIRFIDSRIDHPGMDENNIEEVINEKTKAIVPVHYAGVACEMDKILAIAKKHNLLVIEDAAQAINSNYNGKPLGSLGDMGCFSFHETKNIQCGEGGLLAINNSKFKERAEIIWEKGTNRSAFWRGEVDKYNWIDIGSSYLPSEINAAFLYAQLEKLKNIQNARLNIWDKYYNGMKQLQDIGVGLPTIPEYATNNAHMFYLICRSLDERIQLIQYLKSNGVMAVFHYICLHDSPYYKNKHDGTKMPNAKNYENCLVRLPLWVKISNEEVDLIIDSILEFYKV